VVRAHVDSSQDHPLVLHVEDDDGDAHLVVRCLGQRSTPVRIRRVSDGREAMSTFQEILKGSMEMPNLVFLDLKLPYYNGLEILRRVRSEEMFGDLPVVILTSSDVISDVEACEEAGCTEYVVKPMDYADLRTALNEVCQKYLSPSVPGPDDLGLKAFAA